MNKPNKLNISTLGIRMMNINNSGIRSCKKRKSHKMSKFVNALIINNGIEKNREFKSFSPNPQREMINPHITVNNIFTIKTHKKKRSR